MRRKSDQFWLTRFKELDMRLDFLRAGRFIMEAADHAYNFLAI